MHRQNRSRKWRLRKAESSDCYLVEEADTCLNLGKTVVYHWKKFQRGMTSTDTCPFENSNEWEIVSMSEHYLFGKASN